MYSFSFSFRLRCTKEGVGPLCTGAHRNFTVAEVTLYMREYDKMGDMTVNGHKKKQYIIIININKKRKYSTTTTT